MSALASVFQNLQSMSLLQLLLAFIACAGYVLAQGALLALPERRIAGGVGLVAVLGFTLQSEVWMNAVVLVGFAVAGMGAFVGAVWLTSRVLGLVGPSPFASAGGEAVLPSDRSLLPLALPPAAVVARTS